MGLNGRSNHNGLRVEIVHWDKSNKVLLIIRDGWGQRDTSTNNAIAQAQTPVTDSLMHKYPNTLLEAS